MLLDFSSYPPFELSETARTKYCSTWWRSMLHGQNTKEPGYTDTASAVSCVGDEGPGNKFLQMRHS